MLAVLDATGLPVKPIDPDALPAPERDLLPEWALDFQERRREAQEAANA